VKSRRKGFAVPPASRIEIAAAAIEPEDPMDVRERLPIAESDVEKLFLASRDFAERENVDLDGRRGPNGFTIFLEKRNLHIVAYNMRERDFVYVRSWHDGRYSKAERELVSRYVRLVEETLSASLRE
jgi:hypothetical protein